MSERTTILIVEDNEFVRLQMCSVLKSAHYTIVEAREGDRAYEIITDKSSAIDLAIVDVRMEPVSGFDFIKRLRADNINTPVILATGDQNSDILEQAGKLNVAAVLMKPVEKARLLGTVERILQQSRREA